MFRFFTYSVFIAFLYTGLSFAGTNPQSFLGDTYKYLESHIDEDFGALHLIKLGEVYFSRGETEKGSQCLHSASKLLDRKTSRVGTTWPILRRLSLSWIRSGNAKEARRIHNAIRDPEQRRQSLISILDYLLFRKEKNQALEYLNEVTDLRSRIMALGRFLMHERRNGRDGQEYLEKLQKIQGEMRYKPLSLLAKREILLGTSNLGAQPLKEFFDEVKSLKQPLRSCELILGLLERADLQGGQRDSYVALLSETQKFVVPLDLRIAILIRIAVLHDQWGDRILMEQNMRRVILLLRQLPYYIYVDLGVQKMSAYTSKFRNYLLEALSVAKEYLKEMRNRRRMRDFLASLIPGFIHGGQIPGPKQEKLVESTLGLYDLCPPEYKKDLLVAYILGVQLIPLEFEFTPRMIKFVEDKMKEPVVPVPDLSEVEPSLVPDYYKKKDRSKALFDQQSLSATLNRTLEFDPRPGKSQKGLNDTTSAANQKLTQPKYIPE